LILERPFVQMYFPVGSRPRLFFAPFLLVAESKGLSVFPLCGRLLVCLLDFFSCPVNLPQQWALAAAPLCGASPSSLPTGTFFSSGLVFPSLGAGFFSLFQFFWQTSGGPATYQILVPGRGNFFSFVDPSCTVLSLSGGAGQLSPQAS